MSRPQLESIANSSFNIVIPEGWFTTISIVSRNKNNHLVTVKHESAGTSHIAKFCDLYGLDDDVMKDIRNGEVTLDINPQENPQTISIDVYYSAVVSLGREDLLDDRYRSARATIFTNDKPESAPEEFPDYSTFIIFVEDASASPEQDSDVPEQRDDVIISINILNGFVQPTAPLEIGASPLSSIGQNAIKEYLQTYAYPDLETSLSDSETQGRISNAISQPDLSQAFISWSLPSEAVSPAYPSENDVQSTSAPTLDMLSQDSIPRPLPQLPIPGPPSYPPSRLPVAILGAGVSGLYIAMMLDSLGIKYEILEGSSRIGGRLYTHQFPNNQGKYQYYDVGAMRFPDTSFMQRTFDLARKRLGLKGKMLKYIRGNDNAFLHYNGITVTKAVNKATPNEADIFKAGVAKNGNVPDSFIAAGSGSFWTDVVGDLRNLFVQHTFDVAYQKLMELDGHTITSYMTFVKKMPYSVIKWYETMESRTGLFDNSLTETVLASLVFLDPRAGTKEIEWFCFDGGSEVIHKAMTEKISTKPTLNYRAIALRETDYGQSITITFDLSGGPRKLATSQVEKKYAHIISTMSMACLRMVNLKGVYLSNGQRDAIRQLTYTPSVKIGIQFKTPWWEKLGIVGGQSSTDLPIRDVVYPSYGPDDSHAGSPNFQRSNCLIASYNGMQDSQRLGGLMKGRGTPEENVLLDLVMRDLADLHNVKVDDLWNEYEDYHAWDWYRDQFQLGAFCQFGPGQFKNTYPSVTQPASKQQRLHFAGDATSTLHGWVAGALNSGWRAVYSLLKAHPEINPYPKEDILKKFLNLWGATQEWDPKDLDNHISLARYLAEVEAIATQS